MNYSIIYIAAAVLTFLITVLVSKKLIPVLKSHKLGQKILDIGPRWHKNKEGTPTMGGIAFIVASLITAAAASVYLILTDGFKTAAPMIFTVLYALCGGLIGVIDDSAKLKHKQNEGLTPPQKFLLQLIAAALYIIAMTKICGMGTSLHIPYFDIDIEFGIIYYIIAIILLSGMSNAVNLTDGIDGLCSSVTLVIGAFFSLVAFFAFGSVDKSLAILGALTVGSAAGFLVYNFYPARVFMGDTGSLFFGGLVAGCAFVISDPLIIVICGIIYIAETASVILQVVYFKLTHGKRLFKMAPIHHHFEQCGWSELKIVLVFSAITVVFCGLAWLAL